MKMRKVQYLTLLIFLISGINLSCQETKFQNLSSTDFKSKFEKTEGTILDVRTENEFAGGHIDKAININIYAPDFDAKISALPKSKPVYVYCLSGSRSPKAASILVSKGFTEVYNLSRGIIEWNSQRLPLVRSNSSNTATSNEMTFTEYNKLTASELPVFIDFYAPWCAPCIKMMPMMDSLANEYKGKVIFKKINADENKNIVSGLQITGIPYFLLYKNGKLLNSHNGALERKDVIELFEKINAE